MNLNEEELEILKILHKQGFKTHPWEDGTPGQYIKVDIKVFAELVNKACELEELTTN